jgi:DNA-directed RNA polymerase specialized sigma24 family protein
MRVELQAALSSGVYSQVEQVIPKLRPGLVDFLRIRFRIPLHDAEDAAGSAILEMLERLAEGQTFELNNLLAYLRVSARNYHFRSKNRLERFEARENITDSDTDEMALDYFEELTSEEQEAALRKCVATLAEQSRTFLEYVLRNAASAAEDLAKHFQMSVSAFWTRKSRLIKQLHECVTKKIAF